MSNETFSFLYNKYNPTVWERLTNPAYKLSDLDNKTIRSVVRLGVEEKRLPRSALKDSIPKILKNFALMVDEQLTNAAIVLFGKNNKMPIQTELKLARFKGIDKKTTFQTSQDVERGNAFDLH